MCKADFAAFAAIETSLIQFFMSLGGCINILTSAFSSLGYKHTEDTLKFMRDNYSDERRDFTRNLNLGGVSEEHRANMSRAHKEFNSTPSGKVLANRYRSDYGLKFCFYELDNSLYTSYLSINHAATSLCCCIKTLRKCLTTGKLFRKRWYIHHLPSDTK